MYGGRSGTGRVRQLGADERGLITVVFALLFIPLAGIVGLGLDVSMWYGIKRELQNAADAAALAATYELTRTAEPDMAAVLASAERDAALLGFGPEQGATVSAELTEHGDGIEVTISMAADMNFAALFLRKNPIVAARAAAITPPPAPPCLTLLEDTEAGALHISGGARITAPGCRIQVNSAHADAIKGGGGSIDAGRICVVGGTGAGATTTASIETGCAAYSDPLASWSPPPAPTVCDHTPEIDDEDTRTISNPSGVVMFCKTLKIEDEARVTFDPGIYFLKEGMKVSDEARVKGTGVAFVLLGDSKLEIGDSRVEFSGPISGPMAGIIITHASDAKELIEHKFTSEADIQYEGAIYLPRQTISYVGQSRSSNIPPFTTYIVRRIKIAGGAELTLDKNYAASDVPVAGQVGAGVTLSK